MDTVTVEGIIIKYVNFKDSDKILTIFTPDAGRLTVTARGCRKVKSKLLSLTQPFVNAEFKLQPWKDRYILAGGNVNNFFYSIREDIEKYAYACYIGELVNFAVMEDAADAKLFQLFKQALTFMASEKYREDIIAVNFLLLYLCDIGFMPIVNNCIACGLPVDEMEDRILFDITKGGIMCDDCKAAASDNTEYVNKETMNAAHLIIEKGFEDISKIKYSNHIQRQLLNVFSSFVDDKLEKNIKSFEMIETLHL